MTMEKIERAYYQGRPVDEMSRDELVALVYTLMRVSEAIRREHGRQLDMLYRRGDLGPTPGS